MVDRARKIRLLDPHVANQIAAGEVVERPASVVKELIENSLDAGATRIELELQDGGRERIRVLDNGAGIPGAEALLAFVRHATSKISSADDLLGVVSYGFRGEALASIASVARISMRTRHKGDELGVHVEGGAGDPLTARPISCPLGTDLTIGSLFANVPAREAFLRGAATELGHIIRLVEALALARPQLRLSLRHNGRKISDFRPVETLAERARDVLGKDVALHLVAVSAPGDYAVNGMLSAPSLHRGTAAGVVAIVNGRPVTDRTLTHAIRQAYGARLPQRRFPVGVLQLICPPATVDVNVHPSKTEVRFLSKIAVHRAVHDAVLAMLDAGAWLATQTVALPASRKPARPLPSPQSVRPAAGTSHRHQHTHRAVDSPVARSARGPVRSAPLRATPNVGADTGIATPIATPHGRYVGQLGQRWLLFEHADGPRWVDRATAHEAVLAATGAGAPRRLLIPSRLTLSAALRSALLTAADELLTHSIEVAAGPDGSPLLVRTLPGQLPPSAADDTIRGLAAGLLAGWDALHDDARRVRICGEIARHAAVQAGSPWPPESARWLAAQLADVALPERTRAGGPAVVARSWAELTNWLVPE